MNASVTASETNPSLNRPYTGGLSDRLQTFVAWVSDNLRGDEKGEAQLFLDRLFQAFGHAGVREAGAVLEERVRKSARGGTAFVDLVWKPLVLVEMKRRGEDPRRHYRQAFDYWTRLVPNRPRYVVICNFDAFWIYDFETQVDEPVAVVALESLPSNYGPLLFFEGDKTEPVFGQTHEDITRAAADALADCFNSLHGRGIDRTVSQRFVLQMLVALFAEDIELLEQFTVERLLNECEQPADSFDLLGGLFAEMNTPGVTPGGRYKGVPYFNGGIFASPARVELNSVEIDLLKKAASFNWSKVRPEIFGTIFEHSLDQGKRHAFGAHFTAASDILKIVGPTVVEPWRQRVDRASTIKELRALLARLSHFKVLDPACGSGNFLYVCYRELKRVEAEIYARLSTMSKKLDPDQHELGFVTAANFFGIDINPFAVELAKVTMMLGRKLAIDELHISENALPLDNLDANYIVGDALLLENGAPRPWPKVDVIIGNPPYLGAKRLKPERGEAYVNAIRKAYPAVPGMADYCVYWFRKAHDSLPQTSPEDPLTGRAGLVGTQNIANNASRVGGLDHITETGTIVDAVDNQPWSGEAVVHVSIVNWIKTRDPLLLPQTRRLWKATPVVSAQKRSKIAKSATDYDLMLREVPAISASLSDNTDVTSACELSGSKTPQVAFQGVVPGYDGFVLEPELARELCRADPSSRKVIKPFLIGRDVLSGDGTPARFVVDFGDMDLDDACTYAAAFKHVREKVLHEVEASATTAIGSDMQKARAEHLNRWWQFWNVRKTMRASFRGLTRYMACSRVTKRPIFVFVDTEIVPDTALQVFALDDDYSFGILQSEMHWQWFVAKCSKLKADFRYTAESVFQTFPWPQSPSVAVVERVATAARSVRAARAGKNGEAASLRDLYRALELPGKSRLREAQAELDDAVREAYGGGSGDILKILLDLNGMVSQREQNGSHVDPPGLPRFTPRTGAVVSHDRVTAVLEC
jgi:type I restriction-modification system DNA methylase subunit